MPREFSRTLRVGEQIHRELARIIRASVKDPRVRGVTLIDVEVSRDLAHARVYYSILGEENDPVDIQAGLDSAAPYLRREIGKTMKTRVTPELRFVYDQSELRANRLEALIASELRKH